MTARKLLNFCLPYNLRRTPLRLQPRPRLRPRLRPLPKHRWRTLVTDTPNSPTRRPPCKKVVTTEATRTRRPSTGHLDHAPRLPPPATPMTTPPASRHYDDHAPPAAQDNDTRVASSKSFTHF